MNPRGQGVDDDLVNLGKLLNGRESYSADDVIDYLTSDVAAGATLGEPAMAASS